MKKHSIYYIIVFSFLAIVGCKEDTPPYEQLTDSKEGANVFIAKAKTGEQMLTMFPIEERAVNFGVGFGAVGLPASDIAVTLTKDNHVLDSLNNIRVLNNEEPYLPFPDAGYSIDKLSLVIPSGTISSDLANLTYDPSQFDTEKDHLLALTISDASGYDISPSAKTLIFIAPKLEARPANTDGWVATASTEQLSGENTGLASAVLDGDLNTIWHSRYAGGPVSSFPHWLSFDMQEAIYVTKIEMAPRQNNPTGFTKFILEGSLDGTEWFPLGGERSFEPGNTAYQSYDIEPQMLKNIRITMLEGLQGLTFLSEFVVYTY